MASKRKYDDTAINNNEEKKQRHENHRLRLSAVRRLGKEYQRLQSRKFCDDFEAHPRIEDNLFDWFFIFRGVHDTPYAGGEYIGQILFPLNFPFSAPTIYVHTPNGRYQGSVCFYEYTFHHNRDGWNPAVTIERIITGMRAYMSKEDTTQLGYVSATTEQRQVLAKNSITFNNSQTCFADFLSRCTYFPVGNVGQ